MSFNQIDAVARYQALEKVESKNRQKADDQRLARALIVADAKQHLSADDFKDFLEKIECANSTSRELLKIAAAGSADAVRRATALRVADHRARRKAAVTPPDVTAPDAADTPKSVSFVPNTIIDGIPSFDPLLEKAKSPVGERTANLLRDTPKPAEVEAAPSLVPETALPEKSGDLQTYLDLIAEYEQLGQRLATLDKERPLSIDDTRKFYEAFEKAEGSFDRAAFDIGRRVDEADKIVGLTKEAKSAAKDPDRFLQKAREDEQDTYMADDRDEAKRDARESGESWSDQKEQWKADWIADNWDEDREVEFKHDFLSRWEGQHGKPFPDSKYKGGVSHVQ